MRKPQKELIVKIEKYIAEHEKRCVIGMMILSALILSASFWNVYPLHTTTDELGAIVGAASLAGYDWSGVIGRSGYYGFGFYGLFAPLFMLELSPILIYRIILVSTRIIRGCAIYSIAYYLGNHYLKFSSKFLLMQISFICTLPLYATKDGTIANDLVLEILFWVVILLVCKMTEYIDNAKKCMFYSILYIISAAYSCTLHTRAYVLVIASFLAILGVLIYKKKKAMLISVLLIPIVLFVNQGIKFYQNEIWAATENGLNNTTVKLTTSLDLLDKDTWLIWANMIIGHISVQTLLTGGLFMVAVVLVIRYLYLTIAKREHSEPIYVNVILAITVLSMGAAMAAFMVSDWFQGMYGTWTTSQRGSSYAYKALCYVRYWNVFGGPFLLLGTYFLQKSDIAKHCKSIVGWSAFVLTCFVTGVVPIAGKNYQAAVFLFKFLTKAGERKDAAFFYKAIFMFLVVAILCAIIYYRKRVVAWAMVPILLFMVMGYNNSNTYYNKAVQDSISSMVLSSYEQKCLLEEANIEIDKVYAVDNRKVDLNWYIFSVLQFYFYEHTVQEELPEEMGAYDIIVTRKPDMAIAKKYPNVECYVLDDNETWYTELDLIGVNPR